MLPPLQTKSPPLAWEMGGMILKTSRIVRKDTPGKPFYLGLRILSLLDGGDWVEFDCCFLLPGKLEGVTP